MGGGGRGKERKGTGKNEGRKERGWRGGRGKEREREGGDRVGKG